MRFRRVALGILLTLAMGGCVNPPPHVGPDQVPEETGPTASGGATGTPPAIAPSAAATPGATGAPTTRPLTVSGSCPIFPADNVWHADVSHLPVHPSSAAFVTTMGSGQPVHADFGSGTWQGGPIGIPVTAVPAGQAGVSVSFQYAGESDRVAYPIPPNAKVEGGPASTGDRHVILYDPARCRAYELFAASKRADGTWRAGSGAVFDLRGNALRPRGWTSADAAGLSILAGLVRYEEVAAGHIDHAIRITAPDTRDAFIWPARHAASDLSGANFPPMGLRLRLKSSVDISGLPAQARVVAEAMKRYGVILADNGSAWFISGAPDERWSNDALHVLGRLHGSDFEAVDASSLMISADSAATR